MGDRDRLERLIGITGTLSQGAVALDDWAPEQKIRRRAALLPEG